MMICRPVPDTRKAAAKLIEDFPLSGFLESRCDAADKENVFERPFQ